MHEHLSILSPHLDDAVVSCGEHIRRWKLSGCTISVHTFFTSFTTQQLTADARNYLANSGFTRVTAFETQRKKEDRAAMQALGCQYHYYDYVDAGFRQYNNKSAYPDNIAIFEQPISPFDQPIRQKLHRIIHTLTATSDMVYCPLGIGGHIDHRLIHDVCVKMNQRKLRYYGDLPYASRFPHLGALMFGHKCASIRLPRDKRQLIHYYESQYRLFPRRTFYFPELIFYGT